MAVIGNTEYFKGIGDIKFEGKNSDNPLAFKYYNSNDNTNSYVTRERALVLDKTTPLPRREGGFWFGQENRSIKQTASSYPHPLADRLQRSGF